MPKIAQALKPKGKLKAVKPLRAKIEGRAGHYRHNLDPYRDFATKPDAKADWAAVKADLLALNLKVKGRRARLPTFYTMLQSKPKVATTKFNQVPQGPHTVAHSSVHTGLITARAANRLDLLEGFLPDPGGYQKMVRAEIPVGHPKYDRAEIATKNYEKYYKRVQSRKSDLAGAVGPMQRLCEIKYVHAINRALQALPYGTYAYKGKGAGRPALNYKGERSTEIHVDEPPGSFTDRQAAQRSIYGLVGVLKAINPNMPVVQSR